MVATTLFAVKVSFRIPSLLTPACQAACAGKVLCDFCRLESAQERQIHVFDYLGFHRIHDQLADIVHFHRVISQQPDELEFALAEPPFRGQQIASLLLWLSSWAAMARTTRMMELVKPIELRPSTSKNPLIPSYFSSSIYARQPIVFLANLLTSFLKICSNLPE